MDFKDFFNKRRQTYFTRLGRYLKYVFNDFFLLFLFILLGAVLYNYSLLLRNMTLDQTWLVFALVLLLSFLPFVGRFQSLIERADHIFAAPLEKGLDFVMDEQRRLSIIMPALLLAAVTALVMPIFVFFGHLRFPEWIILFLTMVVLKMQDLFVQKSRFKSWENHWFTDNNLLRWLIYFTLLATTVYTSTWFGAILSMIYTISSAAVYQSKYIHYRWNFLVLAEAEEKRMGRLSRTINLFTDVKGVGEKPKRLAFLDPFINKLASKEADPYQYLYTRAFFRRTSYLNLFLRLTLIGVIVIFFIESLVWQLIVGIIFIYLTGFQIIPLASLYDRNSLIAVYPINHGDKVKGFQRLITQLLIVQAVVFSLASFANYDIINVIITFVIFLIFVGIFAYLYVPNKLKDNKKRRSAL